MSYLPNLKHFTTLFCACAVVLHDPPFDEIRYLISRYFIPSVAHGLEAESEVLALHDIKLAHPHRHPII